MLQQGNWTQEVLAGTNTDKIPGTALANPLTLPGQVNFFNDANLYIAISGGNPLFLTDANDYYTYDRTSNFHNWVINTALALRLDGGGQLTGAGFFRSSEITLTTGNTATIAHGLVTRPSFMFGMCCLNSGGGITEKFIIGTNGAASALPYFDDVTGVDTTNIRVKNATGSTYLLIVNAIK